MYLEVGFILTTISICLAALGLLVSVVQLFGVRLVFKVDNQSDP